MSKDSSVDDLLNQEKKQTMSQQVLIWFLVIMVGVLFGMGPAVMILRGGGPADFASISQTEALEYKGTVTKLNALVGRQNPQDIGWQYFAQQIFMAEYADEQGLMPKGDTLRDAMEEFLATDLPTGGTLRDLLVEYERSEQGVPAHELERMLQVQTAIDNLRSRALVVPTVPAAVIADLKALDGDRVELASVELSTAALRAEFRDEAAGDEAAIQNLYNELKERYFRVPAKRVVTVFAANPEAIAGKVIVTDAEIQAFYDDNKTRRASWKLPDPEPAEEADDAAQGEAKPEPQYKDLAEVRAEILGELQMQHAVELAKELYASFHTGVEAKMRELGTSDPKDLTRAELVTIAGAALVGPESFGDRLGESVAMTVVEQVSVADPETAAQAELTGFGSVRFSSDMFDPEVPVGTLDEPISETEGLGLMLRLEDKQAGSYVPLEEVQDQVVDYRAGRLAWPALVERARGIAIKAAEHGHDGLKTYFADEKQLTQWNAAVATERVRVLSEYQAPPEQLDGVPGERFPVIAIAGQQRPVRLVATASTGAELVDSLPKLRLIQAVGYDPAGDDYAPIQQDYSRGFSFRPKSSEDWITDYRNALAAHQGGVLQEQVNQKLRGE
ncbi:MAG: hypothetical protein PF961_05815 [Planctomycetota bacterium]|jgi:hypothetical protein|nr:hypothetical protein [Planctomycetota bacterium]